MNRAAFDSWVKSTLQNFLEGLQDGFPHKSEGKGPSCKPSSKKCDRWKAPEIGANRFAFPRTKKIWEQIFLDGNFFFGWFAGVRASLPLVGELGQGKDGGRREGKKKRKTYPKKDWRGEKHQFEENLTLWDPQNLMKNKKSEKGGGGGLVRENGRSHVH